MITKLRTTITSFALCLLLGSLGSVVLTRTALAAEPAKDLNVIACPKDNLIRVIPPWYKYLTLDDKNDCHPIIDFEHNATDIWKIGAAIIEILLRIGGILVVFWMVYAGFGYIIANGNPEATKQVRNRIIYGGVGLLIIIMSASIVSFIAKRLTS